MKRVLIASIAAMSTVATATSGEFVFRYRGMMPTRLAAVEPEAPFNPWLVSFGAGTEYQFQDADGDGKISVGDVFSGGVEIVNAQATGGGVKIAASGLPIYYETGAESQDCNVQSASAAWCRQELTISQAHIDSFCSAYPSFAEQPIGFMPSAFALFGQKYLAEQQFFVNASCNDAGE